MRYYSTAQIEQTKNITLKEIFVNSYINIHPLSPL
jgi:hypothetical protein